MNLEPVSPRASVLNFGVLAAGIVNHIPNFSKTRRKAMRPTDFYPWLDQNWKPKEQKTEQQNIDNFNRFKAQLLSLAKTHPKYVIVRSQQQD